MGILHSLLLILAGLLGSLAQEDLQRKVFLFAEPTDTAHVILKAKLERPLTSVTVCLRLSTDISRGQTLFSYATDTNANDIVIDRLSRSQYRLYIGGDAVKLNVVERATPMPGWEHICLAWESTRGVVQFWLDGNPMPRKAVKQGYAVAPQASIILGQDQDSMGSGFDFMQSFVGEMTEVYMWDRVLSPQEMCLVWDKRIPPNSVINWRFLTYEMKGNVILVPILSTVCRAECGCPLQGMPCCGRRATL
ncbi:serum amyloid P-component-like [Rhineura floridana]|uniref:serum amyloid P-component-like n=1 Tax=Rhineura floridana TaxID=261503 RepID=UPI002AC80D3A|nr:serum amyloid P-component-like [Rhineura floridana]